MSQSTDGQICFGIAFPEGFEFPWGDDSEKWWRTINGYKPPFKLYTDDNEDYLDELGNVTRERPEKRIDAYYEAQRRWDAKHPFPVLLVNYCSGDYPMWILAVPE